MTSRCVCFYVLTVWYVYCDVTGYGEHVDQERSPGWGQKAVQAKGDGERASRVFALSAQAGRGCVVRPEAA